MSDTDFFFGQKTPRHLLSSIESGLVGIKSDALAVITYCDYESITRVSRMYPEKLLMHAHMGSRASFYVLVKRELELGNDRSTPIMAQ